MAAEEEGRPDPGAVEALIAEMHDRYVMAQQRTVHAQASGETNADAAPGPPAGLAIELF